MPRTFNGLKEALKQWEKDETNRSTGVAVQRKKLGGGNNELKPNEMGGLNAGSHKDISQNAGPSRDADGQRPNPVLLTRQPERVLGDGVLRKPIDRASAMLVAKAPWWAHPPPELPKSKTQTQPKKERKMKNLTVTGAARTAEIPSTNYTSQAGVRVSVVNGKQMLNLEDVQRVICEEVGKLPNETTVGVKNAQEARRIISELTTGLGAEMEKFRSETKLWLEDIRQSRFAIVSETAAMSNPLKEVRQFFIGQDYKEQRDRLKDFVDLCERLQKLKESGFLDSIADTMLKLSQ